MDDFIPRIEFHGDDFNSIISKNSKFLSNPTEWQPSQRGYNFQLFQMFFFAKNPKAQVFPNVSMCERLT